MNSKFKASYFTTRIFVQIGLVIYLLFILETKQQNNERLNSQQLYRQRHGSYYFYQRQDESPDSEDNRKYTPISFSSINNKKKSLGSKKTKSKIRGNTKQTSFGESDPMTRSFQPVRAKRDINDENNKIEEKVDPKTASDELEIDNSLNQRTVIQNQSPVTDFILKNCGKSKAIGQRIVNGADAKQGAYPWTVAVLKHGDGWCGGSILNHWWVITAAHCFMDGQLDPKSYAIRVGNVNRSYGQGYKIQKIIIHERFHLDNMFNSDIALLKLEKAIKFTVSVGSICLPFVPLEEPKTTSMIVVGWGVTESRKKDLPIMLQEVVLDRISDGACSRRYKDKGTTIYKSQLCTWTEKKDACQGDSGGPAIEIQNYRAVLIGIISYGSRCADKFPGVYTQVSYFLNWIRDRLLENAK